MKNDGEGPTTVSTIRLENLLALRKEFEEEQQRLYPGEPLRGLDQQFSARLGLHQKYFAHIKAKRRNVGNPLARTAEHEFRKPIGWMDVAHPSTGTNSSEDKTSLQTFLDLYRADPSRTRTMLMRELRDRLGGAK